MFVPLGVSVQEKRFAESVKENLDVLLGQRGQPLDKAVTWRDLLDKDLIGLVDGVTAFDGNPDVTERKDDTNDWDVEIPPAPYDLTAVGAFRNIMLNWKMRRYNGHDRFEVYRGTSSAFHTAEYLTSTPGYSASWLDQVGDSSGLGKTFYYWVRAVNKNEVPGPFNQAVGTQGSTQTDVDVLMDIIQGNIEDSDLHTDLQATINKIDPNEAVINNVKDMYTVKMQATQQLSVSGMPTSGTLSATTGSSVITCSHSSNTTVKVGDIVLLTSASSLGGTITSAILNQRHIVTERTNYAFKFRAENGDEAVAAVASDTGTGGSFSLTWYAPYISGFGLSNTQDLDGNPDSAFIVVANKFALVRPDNADRITGDVSDKMPFAVINGYTDATTGIVVQDGVYIRNGFIDKAVVVNLIAGNVTADYIHSGAINSSGTIMSPSINMGTLTQPDTNKPWDWTWSNNGTRNHNFSIDSSGNMHAYSAKLAALTIYPTQTDLDNNTNVIFDSNGFNGTYIKDLSVDTLKIADHAVTVPEGDSSLTASVDCGSSFVDISGWATFTDWASNAIPTALLIGAQVGYLGEDAGGTQSKPGTGYVRVDLQWKTNTGTWQADGTNSNKTIASQSFAQDFGGQAVSTTFIEPPSWTRGVRLKIQGRNDAVPGTGSNDRKAHQYGFFGVAAKK